MLNLFKRRRQRKCIHRYAVADYNEYVSIHLDIDKIYELTCTKCSKRREVTPYTFNKMKDIGLIEE